MESQLDEMDEKLDAVGDQLATIDNNISILAKNLMQTRNEMNNRDPEFVSYPST